MTPRSWWNEQVEVGQVAIHRAVEVDRRSAATGDAFHASLGSWRAVEVADAVQVTGQRAQGPLRALPGHLYRIRDLDRAPRPQTRMERITGRGGPPVDFHSTVDGYLANFDLFIPPGSRGHGWRPLVRRILMDRYGGRSLRWTKAVRTMIKRLDGVRRLLGGDPLR